MKWLQEIRGTYKELGLRGVLSKHGWKLFLVLFICYLIRDMVFYLLLPYLVYKGFNSTWTSDPR